MKLAPTEGLEGRSSYGRHTGQLAPHRGVFSASCKHCRLRLRLLQWALDQRCVLSGRLPELVAPVPRANRPAVHPRSDARSCPCGDHRHLAGVSHLNSSDKLPSATPEGTPVEPRAVIYIDDETKIAVMLNAAGEAAGLVRANGYRCDSISGFRPFLSGNCYNLVCNEFRYEYDIEDKGGRWEVTVK